MKRLITLMTVLIFIKGYSQIPVTDVATNTSLGLINTNLTTLNTSIKQTNLLIRKNNQKLDKLIELLEKNNKISKDSKAIHKEELEAKKNAPDYVLNSSVLNKALQLKASIVKVYQSGKGLEDYLKHVDHDKVVKFILHITKELIKANKLIKQANTVVNTNSIIQPEERITRVNQINKELELILNNIKNEIRAIKNENSINASKSSLINLNKS